MPVQEIVRALGSDFTATALYSLEFREEGRRGPEVFWFTAPESYSVTEPARSLYSPTLRGGIVTDYGNEAKTITVEGSMNYYYAGIVGNQAGRGDIDPADLMDGYAGINVLRFVGMRYRDYTLADSNRNQQHPFWSRRPLLPALAVQSIVNGLLERGKGALHDRITPVWHAYDEDDHFIVRLGTFTIRKTTADKWSPNYSLEMQAYKVDDMAIRRGSLGNVRTIKVPAVERLTNAQSLMQEVHPVSLPETITVSTVSGAVQVPGRVTFDQQPVLI